MTRLCSCFWASPSERLVCLLVATIALSTAAYGDCPGCGSVAGSVEVWMAAVRSDGPKHDRDVVLYLEPVAGSDPQPFDGRASMDQKGLVFLPHVLAVRRGTTVTFLNSDHEPHNVYFLDDQTGDTLDIGTWGPGVSVDHRFEKAGMVIVLCKLHLEMAAYVVVVNGPWFVTAELDPESATGRFELRDVPAGEYRLHAWHKKLRQKGGVATVAVTPGRTSEASVVITSARHARGE